MEEKDIKSRKSISEEELKKIWRKLAHKFHPDKANGNEEMMKKINKAYAEGDLEILRSIDQNETSEVKTTEALKGKLAEEKKETAAAETKPAAAPLLTKEALGMVHAILGRGFIRKYPEEWVILKNRLKDEVRPVPAENKALMAAIDDLQAERRLRKERYDALPKCAKCGGAGRVGYNVDEETGEIVPYHLQCAGDDKRLTSYQNAEKISAAIKSRLENIGDILVSAIKGRIAVIQVENKKRAEDKEDARNIAAEKDALKVAGRIAANSLKNSNQTLVGKAMTAATIAKKEKQRKNK